MNPNEEVEWGVCPECDCVSAWMGRGITCDECGEGVVVPAAEDDVRRAGLS